MLEFKRELRQLLPQIRGKKNGKSESDLLTMLNQYKSSPFEKSKSLEFLRGLEREINAIEHLTKGIKKQNNFIIADYKDANDVRLLINYRRVVIFTVNILSDKRSTQQYLANNKTAKHSTFWYDHSPSIGLLGRQKALFNNFANANKDSTEYAFLVTIAKRKETPIEISAEFDGVIDAVSFVTPDKPFRPTLMSASHNSFTIVVKKPFSTTSTGPHKTVNTWVKKFIVKFWKFLDGSSSSRLGIKEMTFDFAAHTNTKRAVIDKLNAMTVYQYNIVYITDYGISPQSLIGDVTTTPCSPPINLKLQKASEDVLVFAWDEPITIGTNITLTGYKASIYGL